MREFSSTPTRGQVPMFLCEEPAFDVFVLLLPDWGQSPVNRVNTVHLDACARLPACTHGSLRSHKSRTDEEPSAPHAADARSSRRCCSDERWPSWGTSPSPETRLMEAKQTPLFHIFSSHCSSQFGPEGLVWMHKSTHLLCFPLTQMSSGTEIWTSGEKTKLKAVKSGFHFLSNFTLKWTKEEE